MDFKDNPEQASFRKNCREWLEKNAKLKIGVEKNEFANIDFLQAAKDWQKSFSYLPKNIKEQWLNYINNLVKSEVKPFDEKYAKWMFNMTKRVHEKGIKIMAGTDTPIFFLTPGLSLHEELAVLVEAGLSPLEALKSATTNPAAYFNLEKELGKIAINNWADLVILNANPLEDINNTKEINAVIKQGKYFNREHLDGLLNNLTTKE